MANAYHPFFKFYSFSVRDLPLPGLKARLKLAAPVSKLSARRHGVGSRGQLKGLGEVQEQSPGGDPGVKVPERCRILWHFESKITAIIDPF